MRMRMVSKSGSQESVTSPLQLHTGEESDFN